MMVWRDVDEGLQTLNSKVVVFSLFSPSKSKKKHNRKSGSLISTSTLWSLTQFNFNSSSVLVSAFISFSSRHKITILSLIFSPSWYAIHIGMRLYCFHSLTQNDREREFKKRKMRRYFFAITQNGGEDLHEKQEKWTKKIFLVYGISS